jgi:hypothetical protein
MPPSLYLVDYLDRSDFAESLAELTGNLGKVVHLPDRVDEVGLVCPSVDAAANELKARWPDMKTFLLGQGSPHSFIENGHDASFTTRVGFGFYKGVILELAEAGIGSDIFGQSSSPDGRIVINHVGFVARGDALARKEGGQTVRWADVMRERRVPERVEAVLNLLGICGHIHIYEARTLTEGIEVEFLDFRLFSTTGVPIAFPSFLAGIIGWAQAHLGPRFINMPAKAQLPPAPSVPPTRL